MSPDILISLQKQADIISRGDEDLSQNLIAFSYQNYLNTLQNHQKELTIAELTNFMKNRSTELKSGRRRYFGNNHSTARRDVYNKLNYYNGELEILSLDYKDGNGDDYEEDPSNGKGYLTATTAVRDLAENVLFKVSFEEFLGRMDCTDRKILELKLAGYRWNEISHILNLDYPNIRKRIITVGQQFISFFDLPDEYIGKYGLQNIA